ncbi:MAG: diguanylate cyclase [Thermodesulfobacteriota bacterium]|nr:diguanylate cyclase [Thermodesulfobacteriota bacterium]
MDLLGRDNLPFKLLVEFLSDDHPGSNLTPVAWNRLEESFGDRIYPEMLYLLTQMEFETSEARTHWYKIIQHREDLNQSLGREVGLRVALLDYFTNVHPKLKNLVFIEADLFMQKERTALLDELTGVYNRRFFNRVFQKELEYAKRFDQPFCLLMVDIDRFKGFNDKHGHQAGDRALTELAGILDRTARAIDHVVRYGGEEFALILPRVSKEQGLFAAERHRLAVEDHVFSDRKGQPNCSLTVSIGLVSFPSDAREGLELLERADEAMYQGKESGRNKVVAWSPDKRRHDRYPLEMEIKFRLREAMEHTFQEGSTQDISLGGALCRTREKFEAGQTLEVVLFDDKRDLPALSLRARTVRLAKDPAVERGWNLGFSFEMDSDKEEDHLRAMIEDKLQTLH